MKSFATMKETGIWMYALVAGDVRAPTYICMYMRVHHQKNCMRVHHQNIHVSVLVGACGACMHVQHQNEKQHM